MNGWAKAVSPSDELRNWFRHDPEKWQEFQARSFAELDKKPEAWLPLVQAARKGGLTLLFSAHDTKHNNALALRIYLIQALTSYSTKSLTFDLSQYPRDLPLIL